MKPLLAGLLRCAVAALALLSLAPVSAQRTGAISIPREALQPRLIVANARTPIRIEQVVLDTEVVGHAAQTRVELVFRNPNTQVLEGELQFPLAAGQTVTGFALDINGELRPAVPVEKTKGRQVFEEVIRRRVDPALLEVTQGNNYRLRVYPLPALGTRRVVLTLTQTLPQGKDPRATLLLPLDFGGAVDDFRATVRVHDVAVRELEVSAPGLPSAALTRTQQAGLAELHVTQAHSAARGVLSLAIPEPARPAVATQLFAGRRYFYAELPVAEWAAPRPAPRTLALLWDASGSAEARDHAREIQVLDAYFKAVDNTDVALIVARDVAEAPRRFSVRNGDWRSLRDALEATPNDGASNLGALQVPADCALALLFSDGLSNWGSRGLPQSPVPLYALTSSTGTDAARLGALAEASGGERIDLLQTPTAQAVKTLRTQRGHVLALRGLGATDLVSASSYPQNGHLQIAGILGASPASIEMDYGTAKGGVETRRITLAATNTAHEGLAATRWASLKLAQLEPDFARNQGEIHRIGKTFGLVTRETSLIVLDAVQDYVRYEIEPPTPLRAEYDRLRGEQNALRARSKSAQLDQLAQRFAEKVKWWEQDFPKGNKPAPAKVSVATEPAPERRAAGALAASSPAPMESARLPIARAADMAMPAPAPVAMAKSFSRTGGDNAVGDTAHIALKKWEPDAPYAKRLRNTATDAIYRAYLDERPSYTQSTAFFLDAADVFFERGQTALGLRVLSNLAEMNLENRAILRILAYRLLQAKQIPLALPILQQVVTLAPDEPQSYRDLGLAYADNGQLKEAAAQLWEVVSRPWDGRFSDVDLIALAEFNAVLAKAQRTGVALDTSSYDPRLIRNLPLDLRVVLGWDSDNTDIDLWVEDPNKDLAYYGNPNTFQGGRMSHDATGGYGPEEFSLRRAKPGTYTVYAQFFGHTQQIVAGATTLMMRLTTGFGTEAQKDEFVTLRLQDRGERVTVGTFHVGQR